MHYFGRSVSARLDLDGDELIDLAVGALGSAVLLRWVDTEGLVQTLIYICEHWDNNKAIHTNPHNPFYMFHT